MQQFGLVACSLKIVAPDLFEVWIIRRLQEHLVIAWLEIQPHGHNPRCYPAFGTLEYWPTIGITSQVLVDPFPGCKLPRSAVEYDENVNFSHGCHLTFALLCFLLFLVWIFLNQFFELASAIQVLIAMLCDSPHNAMGNLVRQLLPSSIGVLAQWSSIALKLLSKNQQGFNDAIQRPKTNPGLMEQTPG